MDTYMAVSPKNVVFKFCVIFKAPNGLFFKA